MGYLEHKKYFAISYKTGSDRWTHPATAAQGAKFIEKLPKGALILDLGSGRGFFAKHLVELGFQVIGIDFEEGIVEKANKSVLDWGLEGKLRFMVGDALDIPFSDVSFDAVCDFGLFETLFKEDWPTYVKELGRVLKPGGIYFNVSLSAETGSFFEFSPKKSAEKDFAKYGIHYHFFDKEEMRNIFAGLLQVVSWHTE
ncbi:MAG: class I SAM-dependent methyltransferase, partial [Minisyncoccia bacterium]